MKTALVQCPVWWTVDPPLGLAQVAGCLSAAGHEVSVFDLNIELARARPKGYEDSWDWERHHLWNQPDAVARFFRDNSAAIDAALLRILRTGARLIGFSVYGGSQLASLELARRIKKADPSRKIVFGGQYLFLETNARAVMADPAVDAVVRGAGEEAVMELAAGLALAGELPTAPGTLVRRAGRVTDGGPAKPLRDLDSLPYADFRGFPLELYDVSERLPIQASRGCVWRCRYCSSHPFWPGYAAMSGERVFAEILEQKRRHAGKTHFEFYDLTANGDVKSLARLAELIVADIRANGKKNFFGWKINAIIRPEMTRPLLDTLCAANCHDIIYGIESGSPRVLKLMNKPFALETAERVLRDTHEAGITTVGNFMFGFPGETEADFQLTLDFIRRNRASFDRVYASATFTSLEEGSYLSGHREEFGIRPDGERGAHHLYWETEDGSNDYLVRLDRYERFRRLALELGIDAYKGIDGSVERHRQASLAEYHRYRGDSPKVTT